MSEPIYATPAVVAGDLTLEGRIENDHLYLTLLAGATTPVTALDWLGTGGHELRIAGQVVGLSELHEARQRIREELCGILHGQGWSLRRIASVLGLHLRQVQRWTSQ